MLLLLLLISQCKKCIHHRHPNMLLFADRMHDPYLLGLLSPSKDRPNNQASCLINLTSMPIESGHVGGPPQRPTRII